METPHFDSHDIVYHLTRERKVKLIDWWEYPAEDDRHAIIYWEVLILEGARAGDKTSIKQRHLRAIPDTESV